MATDGDRDEVHPACRELIRATSTDVRNTLWNLLEAVRQRGERDLEKLTSRTTQLEETIRSCRPSLENLCEWRAEHSARSADGLRDITEIRKRQDQQEEKMNGLMGKVMMLEGKIAVYAAVGSLIGGGLVALVVQLMGRR